MRKELKEELDKELNKHSRGKWILALIVFLGIGAWLASFVPISTENVVGVLVTSTALQREDGNKRYLIVKLADGAQVKVPIARKTPIQPGSRVELARNVTLIGINKYVFLGYESSSHNKSPQPTAYGSG
jgi:hypothetical protein